MLKRVSSNEHIVDLFGTYHHADSHYLILPHAECDLADFWEAKSRCDLGEETAVLHWMAEQCEGLARGLNQVHHHFTTSMSSLFRKRPAKQPPVLKSPECRRRYQFHGVHGDIKPSNILRFPGPSGAGTLKIADFGTGEFNETESTLKPSSCVSFTPSYKPPERARDDGGEIDISWAYDVWMLGCLYLEFATWYVGGYPMVSDFNQSRGRLAHINRDREFYEIRKDGQAALKPAVTQVRTHCIIASLRDMRVLTRTSTLKSSGILFKTLNPRT